MQQSRLFIKIIGAIVTCSSRDYIVIADETVSWLTRRYELGSRARQEIVTLFSLALRPG
jgi:hypothetical protein